MRLEMKVRQAVLKGLARRHQGGSLKEKSLLLEEFIGLTGYNLCYASRLLRNFGVNYRKLFKHLFDFRYKNLLNR
jgi:hypothetical protein